MEELLGQIEIFAFGYAPRGWLPCNGQLLPISQYQALFSLLGVTYGGNGVQTFALPDLRGSTPIGQGAGANLTPRVMGEVVGQASVTLLTSQIPTHNHGLAANTTSATPNTQTPSSSVVLTQTSGTDERGTVVQYNVYTPGTAPDQMLAAGAIGSAGGSAPHNNMMPSLGLNFCICTSGLYPSRP